jgi:hypothetical protein
MLFLPIEEEGPDLLQEKKDLLMSIGSQVKIQAPINMKSLQISVFMEMLNTTKISLLLIDLS